VSAESTLAARSWADRLTSPADAKAATIRLIAITAVVRLVLGAVTGLGVDESYAVAVARDVSWSYFDHPPLHFWIAGAFGRLTNWEAAPLVRLPFILMFAGTTWFTFRVTRRLFSAHAGYVAALLLNVSAVFSLSSGGWVLPDGPLMFFMMAAVDRIASVLFPAAGEASDVRTGAWLAAGLLTGLAMLSKYHGAFVLAGTALFCVTSPRHRWRLTTAGPYLGTLVALLCFTPVIWWNAQHGFASFAFQGARATPAAGLHFDTFAANIGGQMAWVLPWVFVPLAIALWRAVRGRSSSEAGWFLGLVAAGPIVLFTMVSLRGDVGLPHWQAPGWLFVFPILGAATATKLAAGISRTRRWLVASVVGYAGLIAVLGSHVSTGWMARVAPSAFRQDPTGDMVSWHMLYKTLGGLGYLPGTDFIAATSWIQAGKAAIALGRETPVLCLCADPHHFRYMADDREFIGKNAVIVKKVRAGDDVMERFAPYFERIDPITTFGIYRGRQEVMQLELYRAQNFRAVYPSDQPR